WLSPVTCLPLPYERSILTVVVDGSPLTVEDVVAVAYGSAIAVPGDDLDGRMEPARALVERVVTNDEIVYGITTGFGALANTRIRAEQATELQYDLLRSHAAGVGPYLDSPVVRAMLLCRARSLAQGHSGVRPAIVRFLLTLLERDILPAVPSQGSVGASGDLAPFAHLALPLIGEGEILIDGEAVSSAPILEAAGIEPLDLFPKEGLSLLNGTEGMLAHGCLAVYNARHLVDTTDAAAALSVEALMASSRPFEKRIHDLRPHPGQATSAARIRMLLEGSQIDSSHHDDFAHKVQDAYSLRCAPQVHGAVRDTIDHATTVFNRELGSVVDNPIVFPEDGDVVSSGNFHGQPLAFVLDFLAIAVTELGSISERRTDRILDPDRSSGLTPFLATSPGVSSGYMITQYTAAALVAENKVLAHPASVESIPTSGLQEDHVSMGWGAARKLDTILTNTARVIAVELMCAAQGVEQRPMDPAPGTAAVRDLVRTVCAPLTEDRPPGPDITRIADLIESGAFSRIEVT
ncbi:MAG: histidine ammonia-lyase, partial [Actinomycetota bacterium]|nr:histidine ammonia-lyase [Actinomycetota bacterium]